MELKNYLKLLLATVLLFATTALWAGTVTVYDSYHVAISGVTVQWSTNNFNTYGSGTTDGSGVVTNAPTSGTYSFRAIYHNTSCIQADMDIGTTDVTFYTSEMGAQVNKHDGSPFGGVLVKFSNSSGFGNYVSVYTDAAGLATTQLFPQTIYLRASVGGTSADQNILLAGDGTTQGESSLVTFYTSESIALVEDCSGSPKIENAGIKFFYDGTHGTWVSASTDANGLASTELFGGTHDMQATVNHTVKLVTYTLAGDGVTAGQTTTTTFHPTSLCFNFPGTIRYYYTSGAWVTLTCGTYMFPGTYNFTFIKTGEPTVETSIDVSGCTMSYTPVIFVLTDHNDNPLAGGTAHWNLAYCPGATDANGVLLYLAPGSVGNATFDMTYNSTKQYLTQDVSVNPYFYFRTSQVTLRLETCGGDPLNGATGRFKKGSTYFFPGTNNTGSSAPGETSAEMFAGVYDWFELNYQATSQQKPSVTIAGAPTYATTLTWQTTNVTLYYSGTIAYGGSTGDSRYFNKPSMDLLPGIVKFNFRDGGGRTDLTISGCSMVNNVVVLKLKDHNGNPLAGGKARGGFGTSYWTWWVPGETNTDGNLFDIRNGGPYTTMSYEMRFNNTAAHLTQDVSVNSVFEYQTDLITLRLETCSGAPLDGGKPAYSSGSNTTGGTWWFPGGPTGNSASGETEAEFFPGTYSFRMQYQGTTDYITSWNFPTDGALLTWQTTNVTLYYSGAISFGGNTGDSRWFNKPSMELLPGTYKFHFRGGGRTDLTISGCSMESSVVILKLKDHNGNPLAGGIATGGFGTNYSSWFVSGETDADGILFDIRSGGPYATMSYAMKFNNTSAHLTQDVSVNSVFEFQTDLITLRLETCGGAPLDGGTPAYSSGSNTTGGTWFFPGGNTGSSNPGETEAEFFPGTYSFRMQYQSTTDYITSWDFPTDGALLAWQTTNVTLHWPNDIAYGGSGDSRFFTKPSMELLPGVVNFNFRNPGNNYVALTIEGCSMEKTVFATRVYNCDSDLQDGVFVQWYKYGQAGTKYDVGTTTDKLLLGFVDGFANYDIVVLAKYKNQINSSGRQNPIANAFFDFNMVGAEVALVDHSGTPICMSDADDVLKYYSWGSAGTKYDMPIVSCIGEDCVLPGSYGFVLTHNDTQEAKAPETVDASSPDVTFQTCKVEDNGWGCVQYYQYGNAGNKTTWTGDVELMPVRVIFINNIGETQDLYLTAGDVVSLNVPPSAKSSLVKSAFGSDLGNIYPNPFNELITIEFSIEKDQKVTIAIYDMKGSVVKTLVDQDMGAGDHKVKWNSLDGSGNHVERGYYIVKMITSGSVTQKPVIKL